MKPFIVMLMLASGLLAARPAAAAGTLYLQIPGITGEVTTKGFEKQIEVFSFSMGAQAPGVASKKGLESCSDLSVMKRADSTSPILFQHTVFGYFYKTVTLSFVVNEGAKAGLTTVYKLVLNNVAIQSVQESGSAGGDDRPTESVSFKPSSWTLTAWPTLSTGLLGSPVMTTVTCQ